MVKSHKFDEMSNRVCSKQGCRKKIKQRLVASETVDSAGKFEMCYKHWHTKEMARRLVGTKR